MVSCAPTTAPANADFQVYTGDGVFEGDKRVNRFTLRLYKDSSPSLTNHNTAKIFSLSNVIRGKGSENFFQAMAEQFEAGVNPQTLPHGVLSGDLTATEFKGVFTMGNPPTKVNLLLLRQIK